MRNVLIIGAGAAGLMAACVSSYNGNRVTVYEKNEKAGKKIYITGKGRCNLTNDCSTDEYVKNVVRNPKFTYGAINAFTPSDTISFFESNGLKTKTERGQRVFPLSGKASDVTKTLVKVCEKNNVTFKFNTKVDGLWVENGKISGVIINEQKIDADAVIICTGGASYPLTGSSGDGYLFASSVGHNVTDIKPALVGIELFGDIHRKLQGLSLKNVSLKAKKGEKTIYDDQGEMLFTHFGISGPIVLTCSSIINREDLKNVNLSIDLKPALSTDTLNGRLIREFDTFRNCAVINALYTLEPKSLANVILEFCGINKLKKCCEITVKERNLICSALKNLPLKIKGLRPIDEAIITSGGINVNEINPKTIESKIIKNLYFAGEVIDVDALTGGFNLQTAFSTGYLAGINA